MWANAWIVVLTIVVFAGGAYAFDSTQPNIYQGNALVRAFDPSDPSLNVGGKSSDPIREVDIQAIFAQSPTVVNAFKQRMGNDVGKISGESVTAVSTANALTISANSANPKIAQTGAAVYAQTYIDLERASIAKRFSNSAATLRAQANAVQTQISALDAQIATASGPHVVIVGGHPIIQPGSTDLTGLNTQRTALAVKAADLNNQAAQADLASTNRQGDIDIVNQPTLPTTPASPMPLRDAAIAALAGVLVGLGIVVLKYRLGARVVDTSDVKLAAPEIAFVTAIPPNHPRFRPNRTATLDLVLSTDGRLAESYRTLRAGLRFLQSADTGLVLLITSAQEGEGKTTTAANLAVSVAQGGERVIIVDCDLRNPRVHELFGVSNEVGFSTVVTGGSTLKGSVRTVGIPGGSVAVLPAGRRPVNPAELLLSKSTVDVLSELKSRYDYVIVDSPPVLPVADALTLAEKVTSVLLVVRAGKTRMAALRQADARLHQFNAPLQGVVLVGARHESSYGGYYDYPANLAKSRKRKQATPGVHSVQPARARSVTTTTVQGWDPAPPAPQPVRGHTETGVSAWPTGSEDAAWPASEDSWPTAAHDGAWPTGAEETAGESSVATRTEAMPMEPITNGSESSFEVGTTPGSARAELVEWLDGLDNTGER